MGALKPTGNIQIDRCQAALARIGVPPDVVWLLTRYVLF